MSLKRFSLQDVSKHNKPNNAWCVIHNDVYDISLFAYDHPGGDIILLSAGKDATILFESYHSKPISETILRKCRIGKLVDCDKSTYFSWDSEFYSVMKSRVVNHLQKLNKPRRNSKELIIKSFIAIFGFWICLFGTYLSDPNGFGIICSILCGFFASLIVFWIQHDGNHSAFSNSKYVNKLSSLTLDMIGSSSISWEIQHNLGHHQYTNLLGNYMNDYESDPYVFSTYPLLRFHPTHKLYWYHRFQYIYAPVLFAFLSLSNFVQDFKIFYDKKIFKIDANCRYASLIYRIRFISMKLLSICYMLFIQCYIHGVFHGMKLYIIAHIVVGEMLAFMFLVNHIIEGVVYISKDSLIPKTIDGHINKKISIKLNDWAVIQCQTSINWSSGSWIWNHLSGGLNHQIEHHLFPGISHSNYYYIHPVVKATCEEYGVPYQNETTLYSACCKMLKQLYFLGN